MRTNTLKAKLRRGEVAIGTFSNIASPALTEMLGLLGLDFIILDCEHSAITPESAEHVYRAAELRGLATVTRVGENTPQVVQKYLESGTQGVQMPLVSTVEDARRLVDAVKYPPVGRRGVAGSRASDYGMTDMPAYVQQANEETLVVAQIETREGVENLSELLKVPHIDVFFFGPSDLSAALGMPGQGRHPEVVALIQRLGRMALEAGAVVGTMARDRQELAHWRAQGFLYLCTSIGSLVARGVQEHLKDARASETAKT